MNFMKKGTVLRRSFIFLSFISKKVAFWDFMMYIYSMLLFLKKNNVAIRKKGRFFCR